MTLEARIEALLVHHTDITRPLRDTDRLAEDLGLDGDDAVEFFEAFATEFGVDLTSLHQRWSSHFGAEGFPLSATGVILLIAAASGVVTASFNLPKWAGLAICAAGVVLWAAGLKGWPIFHAQMDSITFRDLIQAARDGRWPPAS